MARKERPPLPKRIKMGPHTFSVTADPVILDAVAGSGDKNVSGFSTLEGSVIGIRTDAVRSHVYQAETLLHELLHMALRMNGYDFESEDTEERVVVAVTTNLLDCLRDNPKVVAFLTHKD